MSSNPFREFKAKYAEDPVGFVRRVLDVDPDQWQVDVLKAYGAGERRISIRSSHGTGKTAVTGWCALHHLLLRYPQKTAVTAPSAPQLFDAFFAEMKHWIEQLPPTIRELLVVKADRIELKGAPESSFLTCRTSRSDQPEALQGIHSKFVLLIGDEASGIPEGVYEAAAGSMSGQRAITMLISNPVRISGLFYDTHHRLASEWKRFHVSAFDSARVSQDYIDEMGRRYGEESNTFRVRVLGEFPQVDEDTVIPFDLVEDAQNRDVKANPEASVVWGVDVARFGDDRSALCKRKANVVTEPVKLWRGLDTMKLTGKIKHEYDEAETGERPSEILVDVIGIGAGVVDRLRELGLPCRGINVAESPALKDQYRNLRSELWLTARDWLQRRDCSLPKDRTLATELVSLKYGYTSSGKLAVEGKPDAKKRGIPSPDAADAFVLTFASDAATMMGAPRTSWNEAIQRNISGVV